MKRIAFIFGLIFVLALTCSCMFLPNVYIKADYYASEGGSISGNAHQEEIINDGVAIFETVEAIPNQGYKFVGWSDGLKDAKRTDSLEESASFTAHFERIYAYNLEYFASEGGYIQGNAFQFGNTEFSGTQVHAVANEGYRFVNWSDGETSPTRADYCSKNKAFTANFVKVHTIEFVFDDSCGIVSGSLIQYIESGKSISEVIAFSRVGYKFSHWSTGEKSETLSFVPDGDMVVEAIFEKDALSLPILSIDTRNHEDVTSKNTYLDCQINVENDSDYPLENAGALIRGRGNTTWDYDKKPYKIKFDYKTDLLGLGRAQDFVLLTNHSDLSLSRNYLAQSVASLFNSVNSCSNVRFVDLYLNGEYLGVYLLCEQIEFESARIDAQDGEGSDTRYLIELDCRDTGSGVYINGKNHIIKGFDEITFEQFIFIDSYLRDCYAALCGSDYSQVEELIDTRSFAEAYIVYELFNCVDVGYSSFNMYKVASGKLFCGPVWDFDRSLGIVGHRKEAKNYDTLWAKQDNIWFNALLNFDEFNSLVASILNEKAPQIEAQINSCLDYLYQNRSSFDRNFEKWRILGTFVWPNDDELTELDTWDLQLEYARTYLNNSLEYMLSIYKNN